MSRQLLEGYGRDEWLQAHQKQVAPGLAKAEATYREIKKGNLPSGMRDETSENSIWPLVGP